MKNLIKERIEMLENELLKLKTLKVKTFKDLQKIDVIDYVIKDYKATLKIYNEILKNMSKNAINIDKFKMQILGNLIQDKIKGLGFVLFVFPFFDSGISNYISNGQRDDIIKLLRETLERFEKNQITDTPTNN